MLIYHTKDVRQLRPHVQLTVLIQREVVFRNFIASFFNPNEMQETKWLFYFSEPQELTDLHCLCRSTGLHTPPLYRS